ncbi:YggS family pyridoxal phosphate-dependent enzyme [Paraliobacillus sediminis]|uniref:YggS family pyridoxal phosphate-dependent enzyme n=1 Tax=Paraliobacillus sediminis TaxID=1885916 RepID=UPI000E3E43F9|nr:YggS family pyridoxal phosphate-dependent enzyme [Paraliobacillus sediminis]
MNVEQNLKKIENNIAEVCTRVNRNPEEITIIGVTKYVTIERTEEAFQAGIVDLAENRLEGLLEKQEHLSQEQINWHFIGTLQSRKVKSVIGSIDYLHSLDRLSLAKEINKRTDEVLPCFVQVNVSGEESKQGLDRKDVPDFITALEAYPAIKVIGLMTMAPHVEDEQELRNTFRSLRELRDDMKQKQWAHAPCTYLSMGMSNDYQLAIEEGATHIRIGSNLVGTTETG